MAHGDLWLWRKEKRLTCAVLVEDIDTKLEVVALVQDKWLALDIFGTESLSIQEGTIT